MELAYVRSMMQRVALYDAHKVGAGVYHANKVGDGVWSARNRGICACGNFVQSHVTLLIGGNQPNHPISYGRWYFPPSFPIVFAAVLSPTPPPSLYRHFRSPPPSSLPSPALSPPPQHRYLALAFTVQPLSSPSPPPSSSRLHRHRRLVYSCPSYPGIFP